MNSPLATLAAAEAYALLWHGALATAQQAAERQNDEALHDLRVAVRRLRVTLSHYGERGARLQKVLHRLRRLTAQTNAGRDSAVMLSWLEQQWSALGATERKGARYWRRKLKQMQRETPSMARLLPELQAVATQLTTLPVNETLAASAFGSVVAQQLLYEGGRLLSLMEGGEAPSQWHCLRLQAKRVRYLLLPFRDEVAACGAAEQRLQQLQELLGMWHDSLICQQRLHSLIAARIVALQRDTTRAVRHGRLPDALALAPTLAGLLALQRLNLQRQQTVCTALTRAALGDSATLLAVVLQQAATALREQAAMGETNRLP